MEYEAECFSTFARLLEAPDVAFGASLSVVTDPALVPAEVAGAVALFAERTAALSLEERRELFAETFARPALASDLESIVGWLRCGTPDSIACALVAIDRLSGALLKDRNPYSHLLLALRGLLQMT